MPLSHPRYEELSVLGAGGQGVVLRVRDRERPDAALVAKVWRDAADLAGLRAEFALLARVRVAGLVRAYDFSSDERTGAPFLVEDFVEGVELPELLASVPAVTRSRELRAVLAAVARTLAGLHDAGFLHGDLKVAHVRIGPEGPRVLDLGAAVRAARADEARSLATPGYAAPERLAGAPASVATDLFALGALVWRAVVGRAPEPGATGMTVHAPWVAPSVADVVEQLLRTHPAARPSDARAVLLALGAPERRVADGAPWLFGRERELDELELDGGGARFVAGPAGAGKSALLDEVVIRALSSGRPARRVRATRDDARLLARVTTFLRGDPRALAELGERGLLAIDDLDRAPPALAAALDLWRAQRSRVTVLVARRAPLASARGVTLGPLDDASADALLAALGTPSAARPALVRATGGWPSALVSSVGVGTLDDDSARGCVAELDVPSRRALALLAAAGGRAPRAWLQSVLRAEASRAVDSLARAGLVVRGDGDELSMAAPALAADLARALSADADVAALCELAVRDPAVRPDALLALSSRAGPLRAALLRRAAEDGRAVGARDVEVAALSRLAEARESRDALVVGRLERLLRDAGEHADAPRVMQWLEDVAASSPAARPLLHRRRAELLARRGELADALREAGTALELAGVLADPAEQALAEGTLGFVHLSTSQWPEAEVRLQAARSAQERLGVIDPEEHARVLHNLGVVALYRGDVVAATAAFERSTAVKRALGDRAGVRASLRNLGYALLRAGLADRASAVLDEALELATLLGQQAGRAWCLAARGEVDLARGDLAALDRRLAEAEAIGADVPPPVRADLAILRAEGHARRGARAASLASLASLDPSARAGDALVDARALLAEARARVSSAPFERVAAARLAARALRRARASGLVEPAREAMCFLACVRRATMAAPAQAPRTTMRSDAPLWKHLSELIGTADATARAASLAAASLAVLPAERAFVVDARSDAWSVVGVDLEGHPVPNAEARVPREVVERALSLGAPLLERAVDGPQGPGARLSIVAGRAALVLEHRFRPDAFDKAEEELLARLATCLGLAGSAGVDPVRAPRPAPEREPERRTPTPSEPTTMDVVRPLRASYPGIVGRAPSLERALAKLELAAASELPVLIVGETGTGKEVFARALHALGARSAAPFVAVNCAAIADSLFEAELFGHVRGSFTGAHASRQGLFAKAGKGTILLDEIGELSIARQASLLRVLESGVVRPVGGDDEQPLSARVVAATNRPLDEAVASGTFRKDLLYRLQVLTIRLPPLRERRDDVVELVRHTLSSVGSKATLTEPALAALRAHDWPGNVRELRHVVERLAALGVARVDLPHLPREIRRAAPQLADADDERKRTLDALAASDGNVTHAARRLGLSRQGLKKRMARLGITSS